jgi:NADH:ubiquinone oxidoreductase subunit 6 (subunit J)
MNFAEYIFIVIMLITMVGALVTALSGSLIYAMIGLVVTLFGVAGLYIYLNAPFLAMMQILIYVGAITILIAFAIMLAGPMSKRPKEWTTAGKLIASIIVSVFSFVVLYKAIIRGIWVSGKVQEFTLSTKDVGRALLDKLMLPFELISLLIVVSIVGAIMLSIFSRREK